MPAARDERSAPEQIGHRHAIEERINGEPPDHRLQIRRVEAVQLPDELKIWFETTRRKLPDGSDVASAIRYALSR